MRNLMVNTLWISTRVAEKLMEIHDLDADTVRAAIEGVGLLPFYWDHHPEKGDRAIVITDLDERECKVVLYPAEGQDAYTWRLGSAYPV